MNAVPTMAAKAVPSTAIAAVTVPTLPARGHQSLEGVSCQFIWEWQGMDETS